ncbi:hypothetical protein BCF74_12221 [Knoellia remsis]|jgi:hypothetical protein|uniref:Uncharacterized protein n=1 Tax=Knoellia remsis TaxID=407159 RepID=A0A2T0UCU7_9MICO|nr:hypothetical protein [Knoellia remsis]PRY55637.1 hypothetical protein BCF74_12221 [Knoellia remsis]
MSEAAKPMGRWKAIVVAGGAGLGGLLLLSLSGFLMTTVDDEPQNSVGVFLTAAAGLIVLALAAVIGTGLRYGKSTRGRQALTTAWVGLGMTGLIFTMLGVLSARLPWTIFAIIPLLVVVALIKDIGRVRRVSQDVED